MRPPRRQGARARRASSSARWSPRGSRPTCCDVPTVLVARTDALSATLLTSDIDPARPPVPDRRAHQRGLLRRPRRARGGDRARRSPTRPYADLLWFETSTPDLDEARELRRGDPRAVPGQAARLQLLAVVQLEAQPRRRARSPRSRTSSAAARLPLPVRHARRLPRAQRVDVRARARLRRATGMTAYVELQEREFALEEHGYTATRHQREVGAGLLRPGRARPSRAARPRRSRSSARPRRSSSRRRRRLSPRSLS